MHKATCCSLNHLPKRVLLMGGHHLRYPLPYPLPGFFFFYPTRTLPEVKKTLPVPACIWVEFFLKNVWRNNYWLKKETIFKICIPKKNMQTIKRCWGVETLVIGQETPKLSWGSVLPTFLWNSGRWQVFYMSSTASQQMILACFTILAPHYESQGQVSGQGSVFKVFLEFCETACYEQVPPPLRLF